jgi:hypothetical protein
MAKGDGLFLLETLSVKSELVVSNQHQVCQIGTGYGVCLKFETEERVLLASLNWAGRARSRPDREGGGTNTTP